MIQMFSTEPLDDIIVENCFHIYEAEQRENVLRCINEEKNKIIYFLNSKEYLDYEIKDIIKYEDIIYEDNKDNKNKKMKIPNTNECVCIII